MTSFEESAINEPAGEKPAPVAVFGTAPASRSAWVTVWVAVQVAVAPGARSAGTQVGLASAFGSVTATPVTVTLPVFITVIS